MQVDPYPESAMTRSAFLDGRLSLWQPVEGYRAGIDPVLLAASVPAKQGERILDLGCGGGTALLCLAARVGGLVAHGVERQPAYAALAEKNARDNGIDATITCADLETLPQDLRQIQFHHVLANPPYFDPAARIAATDAGREQALAEDTPLSVWVRIAAARLRPNGTATFIHRAEAVPRLLEAMARHLGSVELWPLAPRVGRAARLVLIRGKKAGKAPFRLHAPLILHQGDRHERDGDDYSAEISAALRLGSPLFFPK